MQNGSPAPSGASQYPGGEPSPSAYAPGYAEGYSGAGTQSYDPYATNPYVTGPSPTGVPGVSPYAAAPVQAFAAPVAPPSIDQRLSTMAPSAAGSYAGHAAPTGHAGQVGRPADLGRAVRGGSRSGGGADRPGAPQRGRHATGWDSGFGRVVGWTLVGSLVPGSGLVAAGRKALGWLILGGCLLATLATAGLVLFGNPIKFFTRQVLAHPERLTYTAVGLVVLGVLWAAHVVVTNLSLRRFAELTGTQRTLSWLLVTTLGAGGVGAAMLAGDQVRLGRDTLASVLGGDDGALSASAKRPNAAKADPWAGTPRINVLLIGSDAGADRTGIRTDTLIVASIDTKTGEAVLFSLPRNLEHVPFPAGSQQAVDYPEGFYCEDHACMLNALWQFGVEHADQYYRGEKNPGLTATVQGVQEVLGLTIDNYAMLDLRGFMQFVDALGGVTINVERRLPVGGHKDANGVEVGVTSYIEPGRRKLDGYHALWYARSRSDSDDFERMRRQRCVIGAISSQANPEKLALSLPGVMKAAKDNIRTNIRTSDVDAWVTLAQRVQKAHVRSLPFTNAVIASGDPDFERMRELVQDAITEPAATASTSPSPTASATPSPSSSKGTKGTKKPSPTVQADPEKAVDVKSVC